MVITKSASRRDLLMSKVKKAVIPAAGLGTNLLLKKLSSLELKIF